MCASDGLTGKDKRGKTPAEPEDAGRDAPGDLPRAGEFTVHLVGHAHLDLTYRWRWSETIHYAAPDTYKGVLEQMDAHPDMTFAHSQLVLYEATQRLHPELFERICERMREGRWVVVGGMWSEPDMNLPCGESLVRQSLVAERYSREKLGVYTDIAWSPDTFGHNANLPQILRKAGLKYYVAMRCTPGDQRCFWWEAPDGSRVLVYRFPGNHGVAIGEKFIDKLIEWGKGTDLRDAMVLFGAGDHGGGPRDADFEGIEQISATPDPPKFVHTTPQKYFELLEARADSFPVHKGELNFFARGAYTTQARVKRMNRRAENLLLTAEKFAANSLFIQRKAATQRHELLSAWKLLLRMQFHDNLPGTSIGPVYDDNERDFARIVRSAGEVLNDALEVIGARIDTRGEGIPLVVYNPLAWERSEAVEASVSGWDIPEDVAVRDSDGKALPTQVLARSKQSDGRDQLRLLFLAEGVPSMRNKLFRAGRGAAAEPEGAASADGLVLRNGLLTVELDERTGQLARIFDERARREVLTGAGGLQIIPEHGQATAWVMQLLDETHVPELLEPVEVVEAGPVRAKLRVRSGWGDSRFRQEISLTIGGPSVRFDVTVDWCEADTCLKVAFPVAVEAEKASFEIPFGHVERPTDGQEVPALRWIDLSDGEAGVSLLNDCKYGFDVGGNVMRMSILRGAVDMDGRADNGVHQLAFALYPHAGGWRDALTIRRAGELTVPLLSVQERRHAGLMAAWGNLPEAALPACCSFLGVAPENVVLTAMKPLQDGYSRNEVLIRFYESGGEATTAEIACPVEIADACECDLLERRIDGEVTFEGDRLRVPLGAYEIKTVYLKYARRFASTAPQSEWGSETGMTP